LDRTGGSDVIPSNITYELWHHTGDVKEGPDVNPSNITYELCHHTGDVKEGPDVNPSNIVNPNRTPRVLKPLFQNKSTAPTVAEVLSSALVSLPSVLSD
jgi:hypothetical protein